VVAHCDAGARERLGTVLAGAAHEVRAAETADAAIACCREWAPDVAVVASELTGGDPAALLGAIKGDPRAFHTAVVLIEPHTPALEQARAALHCGAHDFLVEPLQDGEIVARVEAAGSVKGLREELVDQARRLEALIFEDALTGLANRRSILTQLGGAVSGARRHGRPLSVAIVDIDHFKAINDEHGHDEGDRVLIEVAKSLRTHLRAEDQLGRLGGEEFLALLGDTDADPALAAIDKLRVDIAGEVTISAGVATWDGEEAAEVLLRRADEALYEAKRTGRDRVLAAPAPATLHRRR
jgi:two-component system, cell cycle response regulator